MPCPSRVVGGALEEVCGHLQGKEKADTEVEANAVGGAVKCSAEQRERAKAQLVRIRKHKPHLLDLYPEFKKARMKLLAEADRES